jgi:hypothetical protein
MYFTLVLNVDASEGRPGLTQFMKLSRKPNAEEIFWERFSNETKVQVKQPQGISKLHQKIRKELPTPLKDEVVKKLTTLLNMPAPGTGAVASADATDGAVAREGVKSTEAVASADVKSAEISRTLRALEIHVKRIQGGSLEVLLFVLGFAKLVTLTGISPDDFARCLEIVAPVAVNLIFGTTVPLEADATPSLDVPPGPSIPTAETAGSRATARAAPQTGPYFVPAIFAAVVFGFAMWAFMTISSELAHERNTLDGHVYNELENIGKERIAIAEKLSILASSLTKFAVDKEDALASAQKTLFNTQMDFIRNANTGATERERAVIDFVKAHLAMQETPKADSTPHGGSAANTRDQEARSGCELGVDVLTRRVQLGLSERRLYKGRVDGIPGRATQAALRRFQAQTELPESGAPDMATLKKLGVRCDAGLQ